MCTTCPSLFKQIEKHGTIRLLQPVDAATGVIVFDVDTKVGPLEATEYHLYLEDILGNDANCVQ